MVGGGADGSCCLYFEGARERVRKIAPRLFTLGGNRARVECDGPGAKSYFAAVLWRALCVI